MYRAVYLTRADYAAVLRTAKYEYGKSAAAVCSLGDMPIINEAALAALGMTVPAISTVYEIDVANG